MRINFILSIVSLIFIYLTISKSNYQVNNFKFSFDELLIGASLYITNLSLWVRYMQRNYGGNFSNYFYSWTLSKIGKYVPSGIMVLTSRLNQKLPKQKDSKNIFIGLLEEQFLFPIVGIISSLLFLLLKIENYKFLIFFIFLFFTFQIVKQLITKFTLNRVSYMEFRNSFLLHMYLNFILFYTVINNLNLENAFELTLFYFISSCIGTLFVGIPAGIGIREVIFFFVLGNSNIDIQAFDIMIKMRLLIIGIDMFFYLSGQVYKKINK